MFSGRHLPAIRAGALRCLVLATPAAIAQRILADDDAGTDQSNWVYVALLVIIVAYLVGGAAAGRRAPKTPFINGALATAAAFGIIQVVAILVRLVRGDDVSIVALVFNALLAASIGAVGAAFGAARAAAVDNADGDATMVPGGGEPTG